MNTLSIPKRGIRNGRILMRNGLNIQEVRNGLLNGNYGISRNAMNEEVYHQDLKLIKPFWELAEDLVGTIGFHDAVHYFKHCLVTMAMEKYETRRIACKMLRTSRRVMEYYDD